MIIPKDIKEIIDKLQIKGVQYGHTTFTWENSTPTEHYVLMGDNKKEIFKLTKRGFDWSVSDEYKKRSSIGGLFSSITCNEY